MMMLWLSLLACGSPTLPINPLASMDRDIDRTTVVGTVEERLDAGGYAYLSVNQRWYAVLELGAGTEGMTAVELTPIGRMAPFESGRLKRSFESVTFASVRAHQP